MRSCPIAYCPCLKQRQLWPPTGHYHPPNEPLPPGQFPFPRGQGFRQLVYDWHSARWRPFLAAHRLRKDRAGYLRPRETREQDTRHKAWRQARRRALKHSPWRVAGGRYLPPSSLFRLSMAFRCVGPFQYDS